MPMGGDPDLLSSIRFRVEIDGIAASAFSQVSGIEADVAVIDYRTAADPSTHKLPGRSTFTNLVLKRGLTSDLSLWNWMQHSLQGNVVRKNMSIVLLNGSGQEVMRFNVTNAWPVKWTAPSLNADGEAVAIETLEVTHEGLSVSA